MVEIVHHSTMKALFLFGEKSFLRANLLGHPTLTAMTQPNTCEIDISADTSNTDRPLCMIQLSFASEDPEKKDTYHRNCNA